MADAPKLNARLSTALATALACIVLLPLLGHNRLTDWDEGIYAGISRAMLSGPLFSGSRLIPHWNIQPWLEKPPLELWLTALSFKLFGISEFTARLTSALSGVALITLIHAWLDIRRNQLTAWLSTILLLSTFGFLHAARVGEMDVLLALGCTLSLIGLAELQHSDRAAYLFFAGFAIALMTKGAAAITLPITLVLYLALEPTLFRRLRLHFLLGFLLFLAAVLPWHLYMVHIYGHLFLDNYLGLHVLARATTQIEGHLTPWWYYLRVLLFSAAPFVLLYPIALIDTFRKPNLRPLRAFALFALTTFILFTLVQTRLPHYIVPIYPALSILAAAWLANRLPNLRPLAATRSAAAALTVYLLSAWITATPRKSLHSPHLPNGITVPDNREQVALLKQVFQHPTPQTATTHGPLLFLPAGTYNPIPTTVFYANRPVQQVTHGPIALAATRDRYTYDPIPLYQAVTPHPTLILLDRTLIPSIATVYLYQPIASSPHLEIGTIALQPLNPAKRLTPPPLSR